MKKVVLFAVLLTILCAWPKAASAQNSHLKLSLWDNMAVSVPSNNDEVSGLDFGIGSKAEHVSGVQFDFIYANATNDFDGVQWAWIHTVTPEFKGVQGAIYAKSDEFTGLQGGLVTKNTQTYTGVQWGMVNFSNSFTGVQAGWVNIAKDVNGLQFGLVNYTENIYGLQIGLANIAKNGYFPAMILVNGRF